MEKDKMPAVTAPNGTYFGNYTNGVEEYLGIPFAAPAEKWKIPKDATTNEGDVIIVRTYGPACLQPYDPTESASNHTASDCLNLNVWTKNSQTKGKPVMLFFHGGSFVQGGCSDITYSGKGFLNHLPDGEDVVMINANYRLGIFGSLDLSSLRGYTDEYENSLSLWIMDVLQALKWVNKNIEAFGGDPNNVTVFGQSSGGHICAYLMSAPEARKYFRRVIVESGPPFYGITTKEVKSEMSERIFKALGVIGIDELTEIADEDWNAMDLWPIFGPNYGTIAARCIDGTVIPSDYWQQLLDGCAKDIDLMIGSTTGESDPHAFDGENYPATLPADAILVSLNGHYAELGTPQYMMSPIGNEGVIEEYLAGGDRTDKAMTLVNDFATRNGSIYYAEAQSRHNKNTYMYWWNWVPDASKMTTGLKEAKISPRGKQAPHCAEIPVLFDSGAFGYGELINYWLGGKGIDDHLRTKCDEDIVPKQLSQQAVAAWYSFAKTGNPNNSLIPEWKPYDTQTRMTMIIDEQWKPVYDPNGQDRKILSKIRPARERK